MTTYSPKVSEIKHFWHLIDANGQILGRLASEIATLLIGKNKPYFVPHLDCGDYVVVINAKEIKVTGKKETQKQYYRHSGYPGGFRQVNLKEQMAKDPRKIIEHAVAGMLPKNKLKDKRLVRLKIFIDEKHPYGKKVKS
ncbi:50S ribosomal protein L13 [Candidatus Shapirobacteria bacterium CG_4_9_14_0_2_um_filter_39_11]|uniref:Large ribosomal subunit protein uL13 n=1 Tax=Candidatus Shapirobacteria bacterium CG_4_9_14_0_2_um_filter_39_11 TaxID=1974478 RepID=A0A2M8ET74_9BACT|nr:MAG: 50S ribosomal protein L13 [Candidatus Shapirobacteria bacterium CG_4_9_14_0_2_um_filter_39_11]